MHVSAFTRFTALLGYLGLAPFFLNRLGVPPAPPQPDTSETVEGSPETATALSEENALYLGQHVRQALVLFGLFIVLSVIQILAILLLSILLVKWRGIYEDTFLAFYLVDGLRKLTLSWGVFWGFSVLLALLGSRRPVLFITGMARWTRWVAVSRVLTLTLYAVLLGAALLAIQANRLAQPHAEGPPKAVMLYDDMDTYPRWVFALGFYQITRAANAHWGPGYTEVQPFTLSNLIEARQTAQFIFLATHGSAEGLQLDQDKLSPETVADLPEATDLRFVYITGCDSGSQKDAWEAAFAPAEVVTFDRLSAIVEHIWWLWMRGPEVIRSLP